jgi:hypothetical protein
MEIVWAAGFFDGEGCTHSRGGGYPAITISQREREPLERFQSAVAGGVIYVADRGGRPMYRYCVGSIAEVARVCALIRPHVCSIKAQQIDAVWERYEEMRKTVSVRHSPEHAAKIKAAMRQREAA